MKIGEKTTHNGINIVLVSGLFCKDCHFGDTQENCADNGLLQKCLAQTHGDDDGIFKEADPQDTASCC